MRTGIPIMLFVAVAGFHNAFSASLEFDESHQSPEERVYEENVTTTQIDDSEYAAAHVNVTEDLLKTTHMDGETEALTFDTDGETEALTVDTGENTGSDESEDFSEEDTSQQKTEHIEQADETVKITEVFFEETYEEPSVFE